MRELPKGGIIAKTIRMVQAVSRLRVSVHAAHACYFIVLAVFPTLLLLLGLLRYTGLAVDSLVDILRGVIPAALMDSAERLIVNTYRSTTGTVLSISFLTALWSAGRGVYGLLTGLNAIYDVEENRGYFYTRAISVFYTFLFIVVLLLTLVLHVFGASIMQALSVEDSPVLYLVAKIIDQRFFVLLGVQTVLFTAVFMVFPNKRNSLKQSLPGAVLASIGWLVFSDLYTIYVERYATLSNVYGSVYAVALSMLWLYCCVSILFYGGVLNRYLMQRQKK